MPKNATAKEIAAHEAERSFYDMTGAKNVYDYITTEGKRTGKSTMLEYLQKNTGVFDGKGMLDKDEVKAMKERLKENKGAIWHGFISLGEEDSHRIDTPDKCIALINRTFPSFFTDAKLKKDNIDLMCTLHLDKPHHLHIHFVFWEKEPKYKDKDGKLTYRRKGKIDKQAIDKMFVRLGLCLDDDKDRLYKTRDAAIKELRGMTNVTCAMTSTEEIKKEVILLAKALPKTGRLGYGSKDMEPYRERVDNIVRLMLRYDGKARKADRRFYIALAERREKAEALCRTHKLDAKSLTLIQEVESDYKRRQGNLVISLAKFIKPELYERKAGRKDKANDNTLKRNLLMSSKKVGSLFKKFLSSFGRESELLERDFTNRLQEIEEEIKREKEKQNKKEGEEKA